MKTGIRAGQPGDESFLAWVIYAASCAHRPRGMWNVILGAEEAECLHYLQRLVAAEPRSLYHRDRFLIAEVDGVPAAALCSSVAQDAWTVVGEAMDHVQRDLGWTEQHAAASYERAGPIWANCTPPDIGADFLIENVATRPEYRRRGLVRALLEATLTQARERGCKLAQISTYIGNDAAISAYLKCGFHIRDEKRCPDAERLLGVPGFIRLTCDLKND